MWFFSVVFFISRESWLWHFPWIVFNSNCNIFYCMSMTWLTIMEYLCHKWPQICSTCRKHFFPYSWLITGFVTRLTRRVSLVEHELLTLPEHRSSPLVFSGIRVTRSLVLYVCFVDRSLSFCTFSFGQCVVCSSTYGFWLPFWYLQTLHSFEYLHEVI